MPNARRAPHALAAARRTRADARTFNGDQWPQSMLPGRSQPISERHRFHSRRPNVHGTVPLRKMKRLFHRKNKMRSAVSKTSATASGNPTRVVGGR
jgi:hypothetical protein